MNPPILVIDDNVSFNSILVRSLERRGHRATGALNVETALALAETLQPERIILDLNLDGLSGLTLIPQLIEHLPDVRIVVLTGYASIATAVEAIKLGAVQYLAKPVEVEAILNAFGDSTPPQQDETAPDQTLSIDRMTWEHIQRVLNEHEGNISATARALKMHRRTLQRKLLKRPAKS